MNAIYKSVNATMSSVFWDCIIGCIMDNICADVTFPICNYVHIVVAPFNYDCARVALIEKIDSL